VVVEMHIQQHITDGNNPKKDAIGRFSLLKLFTFLFWSFILFFSAQGNNLFVLLQANNQFFTNKMKI
jgi:hypothetical protein